MEGKALQMQVPEIWTVWAPQFHSTHLIKILGLRGICCHVQSHFDFLLLKGSNLP